MRALYRLYNFVNILSIDVAIGAVVSAMFFGRFFHVHILAYGYVALGLTVWIIYTADHLRDAMRIEGEASSERHLFHQRYFKALLLLTSFVTVVDCILIFFIRKPVFVGGIMLTLFVVLYLIFQSRLYFLKEVFVALLYTLGVLLPSIVITGDAITFSHVLVMIQFFLLALLNLLIFSIYDCPTDKRDNLRSFATKFGKRFTEWTVIVIGVVWISVFAFQIFNERFPTYEYVLGFSFLVLAAVFFFRDIFSQHNLYRVIGDAVFWLPASILIYG